MHPLSNVQASPPPAERYGKPVRVLFVILVVLVLGVGYAGPPRLLLFGPHPRLRVTPLTRPAGARSGRLTWVGGARLAGNDAAFGGFSALAVGEAANGQQVTLLSDGGNLVSFRLGTDWRAHDARFGELPGGPRTGWEKRDRDSESLTLAPDGRAWVGFESANAIWRYAPGFARAQGQTAPPAMHRWNGNGGAETLVRLRDGRFFTLSETTSWPHLPGRAGILFGGDPTLRARDGFRFSYLPAPGFDPSDATELPNGDLLILERQWLLPVRFRARIVWLRRALLKPGAQVTGQEIARIAPPLPTENFEGIAVTREGTANYVWLVSDDDQTWWRRSYLLKFRLD